MHRASIGGRFGCYQGRTSLLFAIASLLCSVLTAESSRAQQASPAPRSASSSAPPADPPTSASPRSGYNPQQDAKQPTVPGSGQTGAGSGSSLAESLSGLAKDDYEAAKLLYTDGDFAGALVKFNHAYELSRDVRLLWNMASCEKDLRHYAKAHALIEKFLSLGANVATSTDLEDAHAFLAAINHFIGELAIAVNQPGATVYVDDEPIGTSPLAAAARVDMGLRKIRVTKLGFREQAVTQNLAGGTRTELAVLLVPEAHEGKLRIATDGNYRILVDQREMGWGFWEGTLASGLHSVQVTGPNRLPYQGEVAVEDHQIAMLQVTLQARAGSAHGNKTSAWWWVAGSVLVAAGLGIGGYYAFKTEPTASPVVGSMAPGTVDLPLRHPERHHQ